MEYLLSVLYVAYTIGLSHPLYVTRLCQALLMMPVAGPTCQEYGYTPDVLRDMTNPIKILWAFGDQHNPQTNLEAVFLC